VDEASLRAVMAGLAPHLGGLTPNGCRPIANARREPGFDLTFKAPKSVSVLYAVSDDPRVQGAFIDAGETAIDAAMIWLEQVAVRVRRGSNNQPWKLAAEARGESVAHAKMREYVGTARRWLLGGCRLDLGSSPAPPWWRGPLEAQPWRHRVCAWRDTSLSWRRQRASTRDPMKRGVGVVLADPVQSVATIKTSA
jgi:hypothetical protein